mmetsp:Transcript_26607/g.54588  ORF Transcript_26607/g.54588 Transcript_26607/m.54588 type:complete len:217 (-) Transcript_26607:225-875(-)
MLTGGLPVAHPLVRRFHGLAAADALDAGIATDSRSVKTRERAMEGGGALESSLEIVRKAEAVQVVVREDANHGHVPLATPEGVSSQVAVEGLAEEHVGVRGVFGDDVPELHGVLPARPLHALLLALLQCIGPVVSSLGHRFLGFHEGALRVPLPGFLEAAAALPVEEGVAVHAVHVEVVVAVVHAQLVDVELFGRVEQLGRLGLGVPVGGGFSVAV